MSIIKRALSLHSAHRAWPHTRPAHRLKEIPITDACLPSAPLRVDYHLDLICPWCWIGLRHLRSAWDALRAEQPGARLQMVWHADTLLPHIPAQGTPYQAFYEARLGSAQAVAARRAQVRAAAAAAGLQLQFEAITVFPNTRLVCALVNFAQNQLAGDAMFAFVESVYAAYFMQGRDIGSLAVLQSLAEAAGLAWDHASTQQPAPVQGLGSAGGVPHYVFNQQWQVTGAVPAADLLSLMQHALAQASLHA